MSEISTAKRRLSTQGERPSKVAKISSDDEDLDCLRVGGVEVENVALGVLDDNGNIVPFVIEQPSSIVHGLPTPALEIADPLAGNVPAPLLPPSFFVTGDIQLFGLIDSHIYIAQGPVTPGQTFAELVMPKADSLTLGHLLPRLKGSPADAIALANTRFSYSEVSLNRVERRTGLWFETDLVFQGALQPIGDALINFFHQPKPALHMSARLSSRRNWKVPLPIAELNLRGSLDHISVNMFDILNLTRIGVSVYAYQYRDARTQKLVWELGHGFFGDLSLTVPGSVVPLQVTYELSMIEGQYQLFLRLKDDEWVDVFGIKGLKVTDVQMTALFTKLSRNAELDLRVEAALELGNTCSSIRGFYSSKSYGLEAYLGNLTMRQLGNIFTELTGVELEAFDHDVTFDSIYLRAASDGLTLSGAITINGHASAEATISISQDGLGISGGIGNIEIDHFIINQAALDIFIGSTRSKTCSRSTKFNIVGDVSFCGIDLRVSLFTSKVGDDLCWTIYGAANGAMRTSSLVKSLENTFLDVSLQNLALIASNEENPSSDFNTMGYPLRKGVQFCAVLNSIPELESLLRGSVKGAVLRASYTSGELSLSINLPGERTISFGEHIYSGPLMVEIHTGSELSLMLKADLVVELNTQPEPHKFAMSLRADSIGASVAANMVNEWASPFNTGKGVRVSNCALDFGIVYTTFLSTGMPGEIGFAGQLDIGRKEAKVAMKLSQNPREQLLAASIQDLGVVDLARFASAIAMCEFPEPDDFLHFNNLDLYLSTGARIGTIDYPPGASLKGDMLVLGKRAKFECTIGSLIKIAATMEHFELGPFKVRGATQADPVVDIELSTTRQHVLIDGAVELWGASAALRFEAEMYPRPAASFFFQLALSDIFVIQLQARLTGTDKINLKNLAQTDISVYALVEQHLVDHIMSQLEHQIDSAREATKRGFDSVKRELEIQEEAFRQGCQKAQDKLDAAREVWHQKRDSTKAEFERVKSEVEKKSHELQSDVDEAEKSFKRAVADATRAMEEAKAIASQAIEEAERDVDIAQQDSERSIRSAQDDVHRARESLEREFGDTVRALEDARHELENEEGKVDVLNCLISSVDREIDETPWYSCSALYAEKTGLEISHGLAIAGLKVAQGSVWTIERIIEGAGFVAAEGAVGAAEAFLEATRNAKNLLLDGVKSTLREVRELQDQLVKQAIAFLHEVETTSDELRLFDRAKEAVRWAEDKAKQTLTAAQATVDALAQCIERLAFDAAQSVLEFAKNNTSKLNLARHGVELVEGAANLGLDIGKWLISHGGKLIDLTKLEFSGSLSSWTADGPPLLVNIEGTVFGRHFEIHIRWEPHFDLVAFIKALFARLWEMIEEGAKKLFS